MVTVKIYDLLGKEMATLVDEHLTPGKYERTWDAGDVASGVYLCRMTAGSYSTVRKMVVMK